MESRRFKPRVEGLVSGASGLELAVEVWDLGLRVLGLGLRV